MLKEGVKVRVNIPPGDDFALQVVKFQGVVTRIRKKILLKTVMGEQFGYMFQLEHLTTPKGHYYYFVKDWFEVIEE